MSHGAALATVADNLANANTPGFKTQRAEFSPLLAEALGSLFGNTLSPGNGVAVHNISTLHQQGTLEFTSNQLDFALEGEGFFVVSNGETNYYTRAGNFAANVDGQLITRDGFSVLGFTPESPETMVPLNVRSVSTPATATATASLSGNLDARSPISDAANNPQTFFELGQQSAFNTSVRIIDSLGERHDIALHFFRTDTSSWAVQAYVDGEQTGQNPGSPVMIGSGTLAFDENGALAADAATLTLNANWGNGAAASTVEVDLSQFTGFASASSLSSVVSDGNPAGSIVGVDVNDNGEMLAILDNGESVVVGSLAVARFPNQWGLKKLGENRYAESETSGDAEIGMPNTEGRALVKGGALESSTTDPANEFINIVRYQRGYQAGSQIISTLNEVVKQTIQLA